MDLLHVTDNRSDVIIRDLYIDLMVPMDGRHQRMLDLDEFAELAAPLGPVVNTP